MTKVESFNAAVRGIATLMLLTGFTYGFLIGKIGGDVFAQTVSVVVTFWFLSREKKPNGTPPPPPGGPTP